MQNILHYYCLDAIPAKLLIIISATRIVVILILFLFLYFFVLCWTVHIPISCEITETQNPDVVSKITMSVSSLGRADTRGSE